MFYIVIFQTHLLSLSLPLQIRRLRIEIEKLQWLHQQELSEMKHNLGKARHPRKVMDVNFFTPLGVRPRWELGQK